MAKSSMNSKLHIAMFPWLAYGHMIPFLNLANDLAKRGHTISFLLPEEAKLKLSNANLHPNLITFHGLSVPHVEGLPHGAETTSEVNDVAPLSLAMDGMQDQVKAVLEAEKPNFVIFDFADWIHVLASEIGCKTVSFLVISPTTVALSYLIVTGKGTDIIESKDVLQGYEEYLSTFGTQPNNDLKNFLEKSVMGAKQSDAIVVRTCNEMEGRDCEQVAKLYGKPVFCTGPLLPEPKEEPLEDKITDWLAKFDPGSVVFCAFGSETLLDIAQFQELLLGLELSGLPFMVSSPKPPKGANSIQEALPEGFQERVKEKAMLHEGWVPQTTILRHKSIGCFVTHGGSASMWECLVCNCQIVVVPLRKDYALNSRLMAEELELAIEVKVNVKGWFSKESMSEAIKSAMDKDSEVSRLLKENHKKWKDLLLSPGFMDIYIDNFIHKLCEL